MVTAAELADMRAALAAAGLGTDDSAAQGQALTPALTSTENSVSENRLVCQAFHAYIHVTSNRGVVRFQAFLAGSVVLMAMWAYFALRVLLGA